MVTKFSPTIRLGCRIDRGFNNIYLTIIRAKGRKVHTYILTYIYVKTKITYYLIHWQKKITLY